MCNQTKDIKILSVIFFCLILKSFRFKFEQMTRIFSYTMKDNALRYLHSQIQLNKF